MLVKHFKAIQGCTKTFVLSGRSLVFKRLAGVFHSSFERAKYYTYSAEYELDNHLENYTIQ